MILMDAYLGSMALKSLELEVSTTLLTWVQLPGAPVVEVAKKVADYGRS